MLFDELRNLFLRALRFDGNDATVLVTRWNEEIDYMQSVFDNMTSKKPKPPIRTNADRLNAMTVEEKAEWLEENTTGCPPGLECYGPSANPSTQFCIKCWLEWLNKTASDTYWLDWIKQEVSEAEEE